MRISRTRVTCEQCRTVQDVELVLDAPLEVSVASMKAARCSNCGSSKLGLGGSYGDAPPLSAPIEQRADWWKARGDTGISSQTIYAVMAGGSFPPWGPDIPHDPSDFKRCYDLLRLIPEWKPRMSEMAKVSRDWKRFADAWDELTEIYRRGPDKCMKKGARLYTTLYDKMQELQKRS